MSETELVVVDEVAGELQGEIVRGLLEAQGIPAMLSEEGAGRVYGLGVGPLARVQILVPAEFSQQARQILDEYYAGKLEGEILDTSGEEDSEDT